MGDCTVTYNPDEEKCLECGENDLTLHKYKLCQAKYAHLFNQPIQQEDSNA